VPSTHLAARRLTARQFSTPTQTALDQVWRVTLALAPIAVIVPFVMERGFQSLRPDRPARLFEFAGVSVATAVVLAAAWTIRRQRVRGLAAVPLGCFLLVVFATVQHVGPFPQVSWDFQAYERAGDVMRAGETPYPLINPYYTYPPPLAQTMAAVATAVQTVAGETRAAAWSDVFYLYQLLQIALIAATYVVLYTFAVALGLDATAAAVVVALLLIVNTPIVLTIALSQVNILILALVLAAVVSAGRADALAGLALAAAAIIKLYPFVLFPAWVAAGRWRTVAWATAWTSAIVALSRPWKWWIEFARLWMRPAVYPTAGDNTIFNLFANGARFVGLTRHNAPPTAVRYVWMAAVAGIALWGVTRIAARIETQRESSGNRCLVGADLFACTAEVLAITLFVSPLVWPHHFVFVLPLTVFAAATAPPERRLFVGAGATLMFAMPWSDLFPFSYHRLVGLWLMLHACPPRDSAQNSMD
jgi:Glycosyltransferase family 87